MKNEEEGLSWNSSGKPKIIRQKVGSWVQLGVPIGQWYQTHIKSVKGVDHSGQKWGFGVAFTKSLLEPHWEHGDCTEETSLCQEANKFSLTPPILSREGLNIHQKLVGGLKHLTEVKMAEGHLTTYQNYCMYIFDPTYLVRPIINSLLNQTSDMFFTIVCKLLTLKFNIIMC